jgi:hypothetical protein
MQTVHLMDANTDQSLAELSSMDSANEFFRAHPGNAARRYVDDNQGGYWTWNGTELEKTGGYEI